MDNPWAFYGWLHGFAFFLFDFFTYHDEMRPNNVDNLAIEDSLDQVIMPPK